MSLRTLTRAALLIGHSDRAWGVEWHPSGLLLASCSGDRTVRLWRPVPAQLPDASLSPAALLTPVGAARLRSLLLESSSWQCCATLAGVHSKTVRSVSWSPDGQFLACASFDSTVSVWRLKVDDASTAGIYSHVIGSSFPAVENVAVLEGHENEVKAVSWNRSGSLLATCSRDKSVWIWGFDRAAVDFECVGVLTGHTQDVKKVRFSPHEDTLYSASYDDTIRIWTEDADDWHLAATIRSHDSTVWDLDFERPDGRRFASCGDDNRVIIWELNPSTKTWKNVASLSGHHDRTIFSVSWASAPPTSAMADKDSHRPAIASGAADDSICIFEEDSIERNSWYLACRQLAAHNSDVNCVAWNPVADGVLASAGDDGIVALWRYA